MMHLVKLYGLAAIHMIALTQLPLARSFNYELTANQWM